MSRQGPLERVLRQHRRVMDHAFARHDSDAAMRRLTSRIVQEELLADLTTPGREQPSRMSAFADAHAARLCAATLLEHVCRGVVSGPNTRGILEDFVKLPMPAGAFVFACLLYLAGRPDGAVFWWRYAAGAGEPGAVRCLVLFNRVEDEPDIAAHWHCFLDSPALPATPATIEDEDATSAARAEVDIEIVEHPEFGEICIPNMARAESGIEVVEHPELGEICVPKVRLPRLLCPTT
ncbi:hypothetical protein [Streptomyces sp. SID3343]|uniref:hypothetical protein n=1 Tax=Streptomyces sp. SID3343 TaxID=2690260 RepID=UPI0013C17DC5|nr:hypothetical protein [Streptomyces sp. SID3343]MYW06718.1 hypothetical protein [Streptomyces sp. SID3343]